MSKQETGQARDAREITSTGLTREPQRHCFPGAALGSSIVVRRQRRGRPARELQDHHVPRGVSGPSPRGRRSPARPRKVGVGVDFKVQDHLCRSPLRPRRGMAETGPTGHGI